MNGVCGMIGPMTPQAPNLPLTLQPVNDGVFAVLDGAGLHVGHLKRIGSVWKFKAVGHTAAGHLVPGGGPLTGRHNTVFERPDAAEVNARLRDD